MNLWACSICVFEGVVMTGDSLGSNFYQNQPASRQAVISPAVTRTYNNLITTIGPELEALYTVVHPRILIKSLFQRKSRVDSTAGTTAIPSSIRRDELAIWWYTWHVDNSV